MVARKLCVRSFPPLRQGKELNSDYAQFKKELAIDVVN